MRQQGPRCVWLMGLSGAGKTTLAKALKPQLEAAGQATVLLDGDELRAGLCHELGFSKADRQENIRRCAEAAKLVLQSGHSVIASCITPYESQRQLIRRVLQGYPLTLVYLETSIEVCEARDPKGLYKKFRQRGDFPLTGKGDSFEVPSEVDLRLDTHALSVAECSERLAHFCSIS
ncbi:MAG: adenylyl-sulfate kinase [Cellvibrionaceae bacterium]|nr:adenylyl-sulfate kinase [Cellvibrionaceae bacterium]